MTTLGEIVTANATLNTLSDSVTAVFTGATQGIGLGTLKAFAKHLTRPNAIIIGRNRDRFEKDLQSLKLINPGGNFTFIEGEVGLLKGIDAISAEIEEVLSGRLVGFVFMAQGSTPLEGRTYTLEGVDEMMALLYYSRMRLVQNLIALGSMRKDATILSIAVGSKEGRIFEDDLGLERNYSILNMRGQLASMTTLTFDKMAEQNPEMTYIHAFPGRVNTGLFTRSIRGWLLWLIFAYLLEPLIFLGAMSPEQCGERMLWIATGAGLTRGSHSVDYDGTKSKSDSLKRYRLDPDVVDHIWLHLLDTVKTATSADKTL